MKPIKPFSSATVIEGRNDESLRELFPERNHLRKSLPRQLFCHNTIAHERTHRIALGDVVVVVKYPTGGNGGKPTFSASFYCSIECQRQAAIDKQVEIRRRKQERDAS